jgi:type I restriction enzyme, S subunit
MSWVEHRLRDIVKLRSGGTPSKAEPKYWDGDIPWLSSKDLVSARIYDAPLKVTEAAIVNGTRLMPENTVMFVVRGMSLATEFRVSITRRSCAFNQDLKAVECGPKVLPDFIYYSLFAQRERIRGQAGEASHGTKKLEGRTVENIKVMVPELEMQQRVISIASGYDDLIENNQKRIALLEDTARLLYREWFVHFRFPGHEHSKLIDGLPDGWERRPLRACATFQSGGTPSKSKPGFWDGDVPWISSGELKSMRISSSQHHVTDEAVQNGSRYAEIGTTLGVVRGMSLAKEFRLGIAARRVCFNQDLKAFVPDRGIEPLYLFHALDEQKERIRQKAGEASHGTKKLETAVLEGLPIPIAPAAIRKYFVDYASPLHEQMDLLIEQNRKLEQARDLLLPRLMNGEIAA